MKEYGHGGNIYEAAKLTGRKPADINDLSSNVSPFIPEGLLDNLDMKQLVSVLPEPYSESLVRDIAVYHEIPEETILVGGGTTEFIQRICHMFGSGKTALIIQPTYIDYFKYAAQTGMRVINVMMKENTGFAYDDTNVMDPLGYSDVCFICNPNNPTGTIISKDDIRFLADMFKRTLFVIDESYIDFCIDRDITLVGCSLENIVVLRSFSKSYGLPGLRAGYMTSTNVRLVTALRDEMSPWSVSTEAQVICRRALKEVISPEMKLLADIKRATVAKLSKINEITVFNGHTNYILIRLNRSDAKAFCAFMLDKGFLVRNCTNITGMTRQFVRIAMKEEKVMTKFCSLVREFFRTQE